MQVNRNTNEFVYLPTNFDAGTKTTEVCARLPFVQYLVDWFVLLVIRAQISCSNYVFINVIDGYTIVKIIGFAEPDDQYLEFPSAQAEKEIGLVKSNWIMVSWLNIRKLFSIAQLPPSCVVPPFSPTVSNLVSLSLVLKLHPFQQIHGYIFRKYLPYHWLNILTYLSTNICPENQRATR